MNRANNRLNVLLIEDSIEYADLIQELLTQFDDTGFTLERTHCLSAGLERLAEAGIDVVLLDLSLQDSRGLWTFISTQAKAPEVPIVVLTGTDDELVAIEAVRKGAQDYLVKGQINVNLLVRSLRYAIERHRILVRVKEAEETLRVSEQKAVKALEDLKIAQQSLVQAEKLSSLGQLVAGVAHELNNPLYSISGLSQLVMDSDLDETVRGEVAMIHAEAERSVRIVQNLLCFARRNPAGKICVSINAVIEAALDLRRYELSVNNIEVALNLRPELPRTMADEHQIQQVALNLILNAEQSMLEAYGGGRLTVATEQVGNMIHLIVTDTGPGIAPENLEKIFDPFFTTKDVGKGSGLGLSICYGIIQEHGGTIRVSSQPPSGATFTVELPVVYDSDEKWSEGQTQAMRV